MYRILCFTSAAALLLALCGTATAEFLAVDFQPTASDTATGFEAFVQGNKSAPASDSYSAFGTTIDVALSTTVSDSHVRAITRSDDDWDAVQPQGGGIYTMDDGLSPDPTDPSHDWIAIDAEGTLTITVSGLPAGQYTWLSQHNDGTHPSNGNLDGDVDYALVHADGTDSGTYNVAHASHRNYASGGSGTLEDPYTVQNYEPYESVMILFESNGVDDVTFTVTRRATGGGNFAIINSMVITQVPEPGSLVLLAMGLAGMLLLRRVWC
ncbi:MAG: PEP-CTERM sorting domain-containing protein [Sedimentisphaerales bacterium]|nr:PEP-CTERM sorting domain-containing protein [Sedimentisphaerales bacterium]